MLKIVQIQFYYLAYLVFFSSYDFNCIWSNCFSKLKYRDQQFPIVSFAVLPFQYNFVEYFLEETPNSYYNPRRNPFLIHRAEMQQNMRNKLIAISTNRFSYQHIQNFYSTMVVGVCNLVNFIFQFSDYFHYINRWLKLDFLEGYM